jgi:hypothetical protein
MDREVTGNHRWHSLTKIGAASERFVELEERLGCRCIARTELLVMIRVAV